MKQSPSEDAVQVFAELSNERLPGDAPGRDRQSFARLQERLAESKQRSARLPWARVGGLALAAVVVLGVGVAVSVVSSAPRISYQVENAQVAADGKLFGGTSGGQVRFSDGSQLALAPGSQTTVSDLNAHGGHVRVEEGLAHVTIAKKPGAAWSVLAGPYTVRVTGTAFDVGWVAGAQRFDIAMQSGSVVITGPLAPNGVVLTAGQRLKADRELVVERTPPVTALEPVASAEPVAPEPVEALLPAAPPGASAARRSISRAPSWRSLVAKGSFDTVLQQAEKRGVPSVLSSANLEDLSALADAARYAHRPDLSQRALLAQRQRFAGSAQARDAAFFLGTLGEKQGGALDWYDRYLAESPGGAYASQALGRKLTLVYGQHRSAEAQKVATDYLARYPKGPYASTARKVLSESAASKAKVP